MYRLLHARLFWLERQRCFQRAQRAGPIARLELGEAQSVQHRRRARPRRDRALEKRNGGVRPAASGQGSAQRRERLGVGGRICDDLLQDCNRVRHASLPPADEREASPRLHVMRRVSEHAFEQRGCSIEIPFRQRELSQPREGLGITRRQIERALVGVPRVVAASFGHRCPRLGEHNFRRRGIHASRPLPRGRSRRQVTGGAERFAEQKQVFRARVAARLEPSHLLDCAAMIADRRQGRGQLPTGHCDPLVFIQQGAQR